MVFVLRKVCAASRFLSNSSTSPCERGENVLSEEEDEEEEESEIVCGRFGINQVNVY